MNGGFDKRTVIIYCFDTGDTFENDSYNLFVVTQSIHDDQVMPLDCLIIQEYRLVGSDGYAKGSSYPIHAEKLAKMRFKGNNYRFQIVK